MDSAASGAQSGSSTPSHPLTKQHVFRLLGNVLHIFQFPEATQGLRSSSEPASLYQPVDNSALISSALISPPISTKDMANSSPKKIIKFWNDELGVVEDLVTPTATRDLVPKYRKTRNFCLEANYKGEISIILCARRGATTTFDSTFVNKDDKKDPETTFLRFLDILLHILLPHRRDMNDIIEFNDRIEESIRNMSSILRATRLSRSYADRIRCNYLLEILELLSPAKPWPIVGLKPFTDASPGVVPLITDPDLE